MISTISKSPKSSILIFSSIFCNLYYFSGKEKNYTETRFFGPATSCEEMGKLGYTLNGLYLVNGKRELSKNEIGVVFCRFKLPHGTEAGIAIQPPKRYLTRYLTI